MSKRQLEDEIVEALRNLDDEVGSYAIVRWIEEHSPPQPWRFLWWSGTSERMIAHGTMFRALDRLRARGLVARHVYDDRDPPRVTFKLIHWPEGQLTVAD